jgi:benzoate-CoA ligase
LRLAIAGAEGMPAKLVEKIRNVLGTEVVVGYGLTEVFQFAIGGRSDDGVAFAGICGRPLHGIKVRIVDDEGEEVGPNEIGTLQLGAASMFRGYWPDRTVAASTSTAGATTTAGWFSTHDRFMRDQDGYYHHCGRADDLFKVGGKWVSPLEVERALVAHGAVWECAVIGADDEEGLVKPLAFVVTNVGTQAGAALEAELIEYVKSTLAPYKYPRWIDFVESLPRGPAGKLLRYKLKPSNRRRKSETAAHKKG